MCSSHQPLEGADSAPVIATTRQDAAERLLDRTLEDGPPFGSAFWNGWDTAHDKIEQLLDEAFAAERRAAVERIREAVRNAPRDEGPPVDRGSRFMVEVYRVLDEEAAR